MIRPASPADAAAIAAIYNHYVLHTIVTFEEDAVTTAEMTLRLADTIAADLPWLVWAENGGVIGGVALPNAASVALHEKLGFQKVAHFKETGWKFDQWIDVGYWELIL